MSLRNMVKRAVARSATMPAPVGGWNARDSLAAMAQDEAVQLINYWPMPTDVMIRMGQSNYATGLPAQVESLLVYGGATSEKMIAASATSFYNVSSSGAVGAALMTGLTNARWEYVNIATSGGHFLLAVNGVDKLRGYDGTTAWVDGDGSHDITGVDTRTISNINLFKNQIWLVQGTTLDVWYLPTSSIAGAATKFPLGAIARKGGHLIAMGTWTIDAGYGVDDMAVFVTSMGEIIVYRGTDPSSATTWAMVGVWAMGAPISPRCFLKFAGDLLLLTFDGVFPLGQYLQSSRLDPRIAISDKIYSAISQATTTYSANFGWDMKYYAKANMIILNVPVGSGLQEQYVMNTITQRWAQFQGWPSNCWAIYNNEPYFGGNAIVGKAWDTFADNGQDINANCLQAFSAFKMPGVLKKWNMMQPILQSTGTPAIGVGLNVDFNLDDNTGDLSFTPVSFGVWDTALWDVGTWGGALANIIFWQGVNGIGMWGAIRMKMASSDIETHWIATTFVYEKGGIL